MQSVTIDDIDTEVTDSLTAGNETNNLGKEEQKSRFIYGSKV